MENDGTIQKIIQQLKARDPESKYEIIGEFARGGMGIIYSVFDEALRRTLAMKVFDPKNKQTLSPQDIDTITRRFMEEARITAQLQHPNIVPLYDMGITKDNDIYFTMKLIQGESLQKIIQQIKDGNPTYVKKYDLYNKLTMFRKVCDAVAFAHSLQIIHRDIKPENIIVGQYGEVFLLDWGIAKYLVNDNEETPMVDSLRTSDNSMATLDGTIRGTPLYMSPEQTTGISKDTDFRTDIYLLGATLYHLMTLFPPHTGRNIQELVSNIRTGNIKPPRECNPYAQIPRELQEIISRAMAVNKENRYQKMEDLIKDLDGLLSGNIVSTPLRFKSGEFIIHEGEIGKEAYLILKGNAKVFHNDITLANMSAGDIVGEMAIISSQKRSADVVAMEDTEVLVIDRDLMEETLKRLPFWMEKTVLTLVERMRAANENLHPLKMQDGTCHILTQLLAWCTVRLYKMPGTRIEDMQIPIEFVSSQIADMLCIPLDRVTATITALSNTAICQKIDETAFKIQDLSIYCHCINLLQKTSGLDWLGLDFDPPSLSQQEMAKVQTIAAILPQKACEIASQKQSKWSSLSMESPERQKSRKIPKDLKDSLEETEPSKKPISKEWEQKPAAEGISGLEKKCLDRVKSIITEKLGDLEKALHEMGLDDIIKIKYAVEASGEDNAHLLMEGELRQQ